MNVLIIHNSNSIKGGDDVYVDSLIKELKHHNVSAHKLVIQNDDDKQYTFIKNEQEVVVGNNKVEAEIKKVCEEHDIELINIQTNYSKVVALACSKVRPTIKTTHMTDMVCPGRTKFWAKKLEPCTIKYSIGCYYNGIRNGCCSKHPLRFLKAFKNIDFECQKAPTHYKAIIIMSEYIRKQSILAGIPESKLSLNPYFTDHYEEKDLKDTSTDNVKRILFLGRLVRTKGVEFLIESVNLLLEKRADIILDIVGDGRDMALFKSLVKPAHSDKIIFHGWKKRAEVDQLLNDCYLMVFPSIYPEAFGISGIEAMIRAKPVIGFNVGGVSTWLDHNKTGFLVEPKNLEQLSEKINILLDDQALYKSFSRTARLTAIKKFSAAVHINKIKEIYSKAIA